MTNNPVQLTRHLFSGGEGGWGENGGGEEEEGGTWGGQGDDDGGWEGEGELTVDLEEEQVGRVQGMQRKEARSAVRVSLGLTRTFLYSIFNYLMSFLVYQLEGQEGIRARQKVRLFN